MTLNKPQPHGFGCEEAGALRQDTLKIESPRAAAIFRHPRSRRIVLELVSAERSLGELAQVTGFSLALLHYHVGRLRAFGLVEIARIDRRAGRPVKRYRAVARSFLVPSALSSDTAGEALAGALRAGLERARTRQDSSGVLYFVDDAERHRMTRILGRVDHDAFEVWARLLLTRSEAESLGKEITAVFARYGAREGGGGRSIIAYCAFAERD